jgi:hypothetical protein
MKSAVASVLFQFVGRVAAVVDLFISCLSFFKSGNKDEKKARLLMLLIFFSP